MSEMVVIDLFAGKRPDGENVVEQVRAIKTETESYRLVKSPAFVHGLASGDEIKYDPKDNSFELATHSGNLCVRIFARAKLSVIKNAVIGPLEKLGGELDYENERMLVFSIHVSCGFKAVEEILNKYINDASQSAWFYGNVYDPADGVTPLNWWMDLDKESDS